MIASLAVILAIFWLKDYEKVPAMDIPRNTNILESMNGKCPKYDRSRTFITKAVEREDEDYKGISEKVWFCKLCNERRECELTMTGVKFSIQFVDDIVRIV